MSRIVCDHLWEEDNPVPCPECLAESMPWRETQARKDSRIRDLESQVETLQHEIRYLQHDLNNARCAAQLANQTLTLLRDTK